MLKQPTVDGMIQFEHAHAWGNTKYCETTSLTDTSQLISTFSKIQIEINSPKFEQN